MPNKITQQPFSVYFKLNKRDLKHKEKNNVKQRPIWLLVTNNEGPSYQGDFWTDPKACTMMHLLRLQTKWTTKTAFLKGLEWQLCLSTHRYIYQWVIWLLLFDGNEHWTIQVRTVRHASMGLVLVETRGHVPEIYASTLLKACI